MQRCEEIPMIASVGTKEGIVLIPSASSLRISLMGIVITLALFSPVANAQSVAQIKNTVSLSAFNSADSLEDQSGDSCDVQDCFAIQQNFFVAGGTGQSTYWVQSALNVSNALGVSLATPRVLIWNVEDGIVQQPPIIDESLTPAAFSLPSDFSAVSSLSSASGGTLTLTTYYGGVALSNETFTPAKLPGLTDASFINSTTNPPEFVLVGGGTVNGVGSTANFCPSKCGNPETTIGSVSSQITLSDGTTPSIEELAVGGDEFQSTATAEQSAHLVWVGLSNTWVKSSSATFESKKSGAYAAGMWFMPVPSITHNSWTIGAPMPIPLDDMGVAVLKDEIYLVGGAIPNSTYYAYTQIYDPATNTWSTGTPLPTATESGCAEVVNDTLYYIGGNFGGSVFTAVVWAYSPKTQTWSSTPAPMPTPRSSMTCVLKDGVIYVMGGYGNGYFLTTVESYTPTTNSWATLAPMLHADSDAGAGLIGDTILVTNGSGGEADGNNQAYNIVTNTWTELPSDPTLRQGTCVGAIGGKLYSAGGWLFGNNGYTLNESFTLSTGKWKTLDPMPNGTDGLGRSVTYNGQLYCFGGEDSTGKTVGDVEIYQP
jgi:N-acetylneuraminic acid mutarotase